MRACGSAAPTILICLLGNIYRDEGYYMKWDEDTRFLVADDVGTSEAAVDEVVKKSIQVNIFDQGLYEQHKILTSHGIQERYKKAAYQKADSSIDKEYDLLNINHIDNGVSNSGNRVNHAESTQSKVKKSKVNETKVNNTDPIIGIPATNKTQEEFELLWGMYPRRSGKKDQAYETYHTDVLLGRVTFDQAKLKIEAYKKQIKLNDTQTTYIKTAGNWFMEHCWNDDYDTTPPNKQRFGGKREVMPERFKQEYKSESVSPNDQAAQQARIDELMKKVNEG